MLRTLVFRRAVATFGLVIAAGLALAGLAAILSQPTAPRWLAVATLACCAAALGLASWRATLARLAGQPFRILRSRHVLTFRPEPDSLMPVVDGHVRSETTFESLQPGQRTLRLRKFVAEPSHISAGIMLEEWGYRCTVDDGGPLQTRATVSPSRSLELEIELGRTLARGEIFTLCEELRFFAAMDEEGMTLVHHAAYAADAQDFELVFEGVRPQNVTVRADRGAGAGPAAPLAVEDTGENRWKVRAHARKAGPGDQIALRWTWDPATLPESLSATERLIAMARRRQQELAALISTQLGEWAGEAGAAPDQAEGESAQDHWIIRQARLREATLFGGAGGADVDDTTPAEEHPIIKAAREREKLYRKGKEE